jgi:hypothetical protein
MAFPPAQGVAPPIVPSSTASVSQTDIDGVSQLTIGSILGLIVQALTWIGFALVYLIFRAATTVVSGAGGVSSLPGWITVNTVYLAVGMLGGGLVLGIVAYIFFYLGFRAVKRGAPDFGAPTTLVAIGLIGYLLTAIGLFVIVGTIATAVSSAAANPGTASLDVGAIFGGIALIGLGAILSLIGVIGLILGNWRAGTRYEQSTLKAGAIITIVPFVSIVGYLLLVIGYVQASGRLKKGWSPRPAYAGNVYPAPMYPPSPMAPAPAGAGPFATPAPTCPKCGAPGTWIAEYGRWYCPTDKQYL